MSDAAYGNGRYIAVGEKGTIIQSADADHWENVKTIADINYTGVTDPSSFTFMVLLMVMAPLSLSVVMGLSSVLLTGRIGRNVRRARIFCYTGLNF